MYPLLKPGTMVIVCKYSFSKLKRGDIIAVRDPRDGKVLIKRINKIENGSYFVEGDNKTVSTDSRKFGWIKKSHVIGKAIYIL